MPEEHSVPVRMRSSAWQLPAIIIATLVALGALGFAWSDSAKLDATKQAVAEQVRSMQRSVQQDMTAMKDRLATNERKHTDLQSDLKVVTDKLKITQTELKKARHEAIEKSTRTAEMVRKLDTSMRTELATKASSDEVKTVDTRLAKVSTDLAKTINDLNMTRSELGTLIARNHDEIDVLRRQRDRDYIEFTIVGKNQPQKIGNITVELKAINGKKNRTSFAYTVEDKRYEAKNANLNSPLFFYLPGKHQPEELVVNKISQNTMSGYLSIPKTAP
jgi:septal ring factor EnvC (AmiA/AmiB activator)